MILLELNDASVDQGELALEDDAAWLREAEGPRLMQALDAVNKRYGRGSLLLASAGLAGDRRIWGMKQERMTPGYTTCWAEMPIVRA